MTDMELMEEYGVPVPLPEDFDIEESYTLAYNVWLIGFDAYLWCAILYGADTEEAVRKSKIQKVGRTIWQRQIKNACGFPTG